MTALKWIALCVLGLAIVYGALFALGAWRWSRVTQGLVNRLAAGAVAHDVSRYDVGEVADLPAPVRRYFETALNDGQTIIQSADIALEGMFNMSLEAPQWKGFTSSQHVVTNRPGFVWNARITMFTGVPVRVHDAYVSGEGFLSPSLLGLFSLGDVQGDGEIARSELMRWLAEAVWYPTALLPSQGVTWQPVDAMSALATLTDGTIELAMLFRFREDGLVSGIRVEAREGTIEGKEVMMPWEGKFDDYRTKDGMLVPFFGEVAWITPMGERPYFRGSITSVTYRLAR